MSLLTICFIIFVLTIIGYCSGKYSLAVFALTSMMLMMLTGVFCAKLHITGLAFNRQVNSFVMNILLVCTILNAVLTAKERVSGVVLAEYLGVLILMYVISMLIVVGIPSRTTRRGIGVCVIFRCCCS